jgi:hypothetical protein
LIHWCRRSWPRPAGYFLILFLWKFIAIHKQRIVRAKVRPPWGVHPISWAEKCGGFDSP